MNDERIEALDKELSPESLNSTQCGDEMLSEIEEGSELYEHIRMTVDPGQQPERIDTFLTSHISNISRNRVQNAAKAGNILVNDKVVKSNYKVKPNDVISIVFSYPPRETDIKPEPIPLNIVYEDDDIIVINKQAGLVVHPAHGNFTGTLLHGLAYHFEQTHQNVENRIGYLVHRIDKDTTGLMIVAKTRLPKLSWPSNSSTTPSTAAITPWFGAISMRTKAPLWATLGAAKTTAAAWPSILTASKARKPSPTGKCWNALAM